MTGDDGYPDLIDALITSICALGARSHITLIQWLVCEGRLLFGFDPHAADYIETYKHNGRLGGMYGHDDVRP
jgi:hypothetical protein